MTRRAFLLAPFILAQKAEAAGLHLTGTLTANDQEAQEGYFALCSETGKCQPTDTLVLSAHPKSPLYPLLRGMVGTTVQVSVFQT